MKKIFVMMFAFVIAMGMYSCKNGAAPAGEKADSTQVAPEQQQEETPDIAALIEKVKAEGADWNEDQWKDCFRQSMLAIKPMMVEIETLTKQMEEDPAKAAEVMAKMEEIQKKYEGLEQQMDELDELFKANPIAKKLNDDEEFIKKLKEEVGLPDM